MSGEVHREIERRDGADDAERLADGEGEFMLAAWCAGERDGLALETLGFLGREDQRLVSAPNLATGVAQRFAGLGRQRRGKFFCALAHEVSCLEDDGIALIGGELDLAEGLFGSVDGSMAFCFTRDGNLCDDIIRLFIINGDGLLGHDVLTTDVQRLFFHGDTSCLFIIYILPRHKSQRVIAIFSTSSLRIVSGVTSSMWLAVQ